MRMSLWEHLYLCATVCMSAHVQTLAWKQEADGERETVARRWKDSRGSVTDNRWISWLVCMNIPLFSMACMRPTRAGGAVSGGVNCSLRSGTGTAETTTQISVTLLHWQTLLLSTSTKRSRARNMFIICTKLRRNTIKHNGSLHWVFISQAQPFSKAPWDLFILHLFAQYLINKTKHFL